MDDYIVTDAILRKIDQTGRLKYTLSATDIRHYPDDESTDMLKPTLVHFQARKPPVTMSAERGHISKDGEKVDLYENVRIRRSASAQYEELTAFTTELTVLPDVEKAVTKSPVLITQGKSWVKGVGMQVDNQAQTYLLESQAFAVLEEAHQFPSLRGWLMSNICCLLEETPTQSSARSTLQKGFEQLEKIDNRRKSTH